MAKVEKVDRSKPSPGDGASLPIREVTAGGVVIIASGEKLKNLNPDDIEAGLRTSAKLGGRPVILLDNATLALKVPAGAKPGNIDATVIRAVQSDN